MILIFLQDIHPWCHLVLHYAQITKSLQIGMPIPRRFSFLGDQGMAISYSSRIGETKKSYSPGFRGIVFPLNKQIDIKLKQSLRNW